MEEKELMSVFFTGCKRSIEGGRKQDLNKIAF
jgi:hypothetical protein